MNSHKAKNYSLIILGISICLCVLLGWQARTFEIDASADTLLTKSNQNYIVNQIADERYDPEEFILIAFEPVSKQIYTAQSLNILTELDRKISDIPRVKTVRSIANVPLFTGLENFSTDIKVDNLTWEAKRYDADTLEKKLASHPLYEGLLINEEHTALGIQVTFDTPKELSSIDSQIVAIQRQRLDGELTEKDEEQLSKLNEQRSGITNNLDKKRIDEIKAIRSVLKDYGDEGQFYLGGNNLLAYELINIIKKDLILFGIVIVIAVSLVILLLFKKLRWVLLSLSGCFASVVCTLGLLAVFDLKVTVISANVIALQIILTLALIIHLIVQYQELARAGGGDHYSYVIATVRKKFRPCIYAGLTTAIGFGSLIFSGVQPVISFGWMMVVAMLVTITISLTLFPALLILGFKKPPAFGEHAFIQSAMHKAATFAKQRPGFIITGSLVLIAAGIAGSLRLSAENSFLNYFSDSTDVHRELTFIDQQFGGSTTLDILYSPPQAQQQSDLVLTAESVQMVEKIQDKLSQHKAIGAITSVADFTLIAKTVAGKPLTEYELTAFYRALDKNLREDFFGAYFDAGQTQLRISTRIKDSLPELDREQLMHNIHRDLSDLGLSKDDYTLTGIFVLYQDILSRLVDSQVKTIAIVYLAMAVMLWMVFRSLRIALIALIPNIVTTVCVLGFMGLAGITLDLMTLTIAAVAMGISVDDTIHYIHRYQHELQSGSKDALTTTHLSVGYALLYTTIVIIFGFVALVFSDFVPSIMFGLLTSCAMAIAFLTDMTTLPALLDKFIGQRATGKST